MAERDDRIGVPAGGGRGTLWFDPREDATAWEIARCLEVLVKCAATRDGRAAARLGYDNLPGPCKRHFVESEPPPPEPAGASWWAWLTGR